jgi:hypothetical protein
MKEEKLYDAVQKYLEANGWKLAAIGGTAVKQEIGAFKYNYEFVVRFTGSEVEPTEQTRCLKKRPKKRGKR